MAIYTGGKKPRVPRSAPGKGDRGTGAAQFNGKDVLQFAPNFSVYVLPPDVVCLYSEDRKFFLHGELYCAVADAIGGGKSFAQIARDLGKKYPPDSVNEALKRLIDRRYVSARKTRTAGGIAASYWASLGLPPAVVEENLQKCRVRIQSIDVKGASELAAALKKLGVRVVAGKADLTVAVVNDYLEPRLAELNKKQLSDKTPWLLVQPSGIFPLVGPVFTPGESACWACLADRMTRNREVKSLLDRKQARRVAASPLAKETLGPQRNRRLPPSRSPRRSPPVSAPICAIISSASISWARASSSITSPAARNVRSAARRSCAIRAALRRRSSSRAARS